METTSEAIRLLQDALAKSREAQRVIDNLIAPHDYQDVATLFTQAASMLLQSATHLMQSQDMEALELLENAEDLLDSAWDIIDGETDED